MKNIRQFNVVPSLPERISRLKDIAFNFWWTWDTEALSLWRRMDLDLWEEVYHNPLKMLGQIPQARLKELSQDDSFLAHLDRVCERLDNYLAATTWFDNHYDNPQERVIAYFSFEYGLAESFASYSGGLGILSGDHLRSASELGLPLVGVGLFYNRGYFRQYLNSDGWQQEYLPKLDTDTLPLQLQKDSDGKPILLEMTIGRRVVTARIWKVSVGRVSLYLLDTNLDSNHPEDREITSQLYGGDQNLRIRQEILLGIGGLRALNLLGIEPAICHMNEGHAAFMALERIRIAMSQHQLSFDEARYATTAGTVFTTHTPVPAGNDRFPVPLMEEFFSNYFKDMGLTWNRFLGLGRENENDSNESFCMTVLALKLSGFCNGVSELHGDTSRKMWRSIWPEVPNNEIPVGHITNGIHIRTWISGEMASLFDRYLGMRWWMDPIDSSVWERIDRIPDAELWRTHERRSERLVSFVRERLRIQLERRGRPHSEVAIADEVLDPDCLTIGFARRFATYKRATLLFQNLDRLKSLLNHSERPIQLVFAGKAHPADHQGKELIRQIVHFCRMEEFRHRIVFVEDYDMNVARYLLQGVDVWLNTPRRPLEASGTSGMKAAANGVLNFSIPDGWWEEGFAGDNGWNIGSGEDYSDSGYQDRIESEAIYDILEKEIAPLYYDRGRDDLPRNWIRRMKRAMITCCPVYNTNRMLREYSEKYYFEATDKHFHMTDNDYEHARKLGQWSQSVFGQWPQVEIKGVTILADSETVTVGQEMPFRVEVQLGDLSHDNVDVEIYYGLLSPEREMLDGRVLKLAYTRTSAEGLALFEGQMTCHVSGQFGFQPRLMAKHADLPIQDRLRSLKWG